MPWGVSPLSIGCEGEIPIGRGTALAPPGDHPAKHKSGFNEEFTLANCDHASIKLSGDQRLPLRVSRLVRARISRLTLRVLNFLLAMLAGAALPVQTGVNSTLRQTVGHPLWATIISFSVGALSAGLLLLVLRVPLPTAFPPLGWRWLGGSLGVIYIGISLLLAPRLGAASLVGTVVAGQLCASLILDHFGWLGFPQHLVSAPRVLGAVLLGAGVWLISRF